MDASAAFSCVLVLWKSFKGPNYTSFGFEISENTHVLHNYKNFMVESNVSILLY